MILTLCHNYVILKLILISILTSFFTFKQIFQQLFILFILQNCYLFHNTIMLRLSIDQFIIDAIALA